MLFLEHRHLHYDLKVAVRQMQALRVQEIKSALLDTCATSPKHNITIYSYSILRESHVFSVCLFFVSKIPSLTKPSTLFCTEKMLITRIIKRVGFMEKANK